MRELWFCKKRWIFLLLRIAASKSDIFHKIYIPPLCINCTCWQSHSSWMILQDTKPFPPVDSQTSAAQQYHRFLPRSEELKHVHQWWSTVTRCNIFTCVSWGKVVDFDVCRWWTSMIQTTRNELKRMTTIFFSHKDQYALFEEGIKKWVVTVTLQTASFIRCLDHCVVNQRIWHGDTQTYKLTDASHLVVRDERAASKHGSTTFHYTSSQAYQGCGALTSSLCLFSRLQQLSG